MDIKSFEDFKSLSNYQKTLYLDNGIADAPLFFDKTDLYQFIRDVFNECDNYQKTIALKSLVNFILLDKLDVRHGLSLLIDNWSITQNTFVELERCKSLFYFYEHEENEIQKVFDKYSKNIDPELSSEGYFQLGKIHLIESFKSSDFKDFENHLGNSLDYFGRSKELIENRTDSDFYINFGKSLIALKRQKFGAFDLLLSKLSAIIFKREAYSFTEGANTTLISLLRSLGALRKIFDENPSSWVDFRTSLNEFYYYFCEIFNDQLKTKLQNSSLASLFQESVNEIYLQPYFSISFEAEKQKLNKLLSEEDEGTDKHNFIKWVIDLSNNDSLKKKASSDLVKEKFKDLFLDNVPPEIFNEATKKIDNNSSVVEILSALEKITKPDQNKIFSSIIDACAKLQGNNKYWNDKASEDERNTLIRSLLSASGKNVRDQTLWSVSDAGKQSGEIDLLIIGSNGMPVNFIEALNLRSVNRDYINLHLRKLFKYDTLGLENNYMLVYYIANNFSSFCPKYLKHISQYSYKYSLVDINKIDMGLADIIIYKAEHTRNDSKTSLNHIIIDLAKG